MYVHEREKRWKDNVQGGLNGIGDLEESRPTLLKVIGDDGLNDRDLKRAGRV